MRRTFIPLSCQTYVIQKLEKKIEVVLGIRYTSPYESNKIRVEDFLMLFKYAIKIKRFTKRVFSIDQYVTNLDYLPNIQ